MARVATTTKGPAPNNIWPLVKGLPGSLAGIDAGRWRGVAR